MKLLLIINALLIALLGVGLAIKNMSPNNAAMAFLLCSSTCLILTGIVHIIHLIEKKNKS